MVNKVYCYHEIERRFNLACFPYYELYRKEVRKPKKIRKLTDEQMKALNVLVNKMNQKRCWYMLAGCNATFAQLGHPNLYKDVVDKPPTEDIDMSIVDEKVHEMAKIIREKDTFMTDLFSNKWCDCGKEM